MRVEQPYTISPFGQPGSVPNAEYPSSRERSVIAHLTARPPLAQLDLDGHRRPRLQAARLPLQKWVISRCSNSVPHSSAAHPIPDVLSHYAADCRGCVSCSSYCVPLGQLCLRRALGQERLSLRSEVRLVWNRHSPDQVWEFHEEELAIQWATPEGLGVSGAKHRALGSVD